MGKPKLGQVFLTDLNIINKILNSLLIVPEYSLLEIGCGDGILTEALSCFENPLTVIEIDEICINNTKKRLSSKDAITWICDDVLNCDFSQLTAPVLLVANIPYYISAKLIQKLVNHKTLFANITIMIQKEFAQKCIAKPFQKSYTSLSVFTQYHFDVDYLFDVSKRCFNPVPNIDSAVIRLTPNSVSYNQDARCFETVVNACFWGKRKKLSTSLRQNPFCSFSLDVRDLSAISHLLSKRADQLNKYEYVDLVNALKPYILLE
tara:strand:+ start:1066 stop:1854 length:789 start_codon:yes stop_codon:yes gene_type:complete